MRRYFTWADILLASLGLAFAAVCVTVMVMR